MNRDLDFWRQLDILPPSSLSNSKVTIIGVGGIGSPTALTLAKMGVPSITVYDHDSVELHNLPSQMYFISDLGKSKVDALKETITDWAGIEVAARPEQFDQQRVSGIVISGVDTMKTRSDIWRQMKFNPSVELYIEARMGAEVCRIHTINPTDPDDVSWYETTLYSDEGALEQPCTARSIIYTVQLVAGLIASQVKKFVTNESLKREIIFDFVTLTLMIS